MFKQAEKQAREENVLIQDLKTKKECARNLQERKLRNYGSRWWFKNPKLRFVKIETLAEAKE